MYYYPFYTDSRTKCSQNYFNNRPTSAITQIEFTLSESPDSPTLLKKATVIAALDEYKRIVITKPTSTKSTLLKRLSVA